MGSLGGDQNTTMRADMEKIEETQDKRVCPRCHEEMTPCQIENPTRVYDRESGWEGLPCIDAWYCDHCKLVMEDGEIPF